MNKPSMNKPRVLVLTAAGKTGLPTALQLLREGFPVTAFVRREDRRSERLRHRARTLSPVRSPILSICGGQWRGRGAPTFVPPLAAGYLTAGAVFAAAAAEQQAGVGCRHEPMAFQSASPCCPYARMLADRPAAGAACQERM